MNIGENFDDIMLKNKEYFDLSNFSKDSKYYCVDNKKVPGKMKDEYGSTLILQYAGTEPKLHTVIDVNNYEKSTHKGHSSNFRSSEFKDTLFNKKVFRHITKKYILKKAIKYLYLALMIKHIFLMME